MNETRPTRLTRDADARHQTSSLTLTIPFLPLTHSPPIDGRGKRRYKNKQGVPEAEESPFQKEIGGDAAETPGAHAHGAPREKTGVQVERVIVSLTG